jgi:voltage-gated potassium channel
LSAELKYYQTYSVKTHFFLRASALGYNPHMENIKSFFEGSFSKIIGILIILSIADQVLTSMELTRTVERIFDVFYLLTITLFSLEFLIRIIVIRKFDFLLAVDAIVLINAIFIGLVDLRMLRLFRLFQIFRASKFLVPTNTLIKTIVMQRNALLGSQMMVISILLVVSTLIYFLESEAQPEIFGSIPAAMWWGIATLTTVGYGDVVPSTEVGKILASFTMFIGIGMFALPAAILASAYYEEIQKRNFLITFEAIAAIPLFQQLPVGAINKINEKLDVKLFQRNEEIFKKGDEGDAMFIIEQGQVKVDLEDPVYLGPGDFFGEMALISNSPRNATLVATDDSKLFELKKSDLEELFDEHEVLFRELEETIKKRLA